jgi:hypothetical protein
MPVNPVPSLHGLAAVLLKMLKDCGYWKPADVRPPAPPLPQDDQFTSTDQVFYFFTQMSPDYMTYMHGISLKNHADNTPKRSVTT